MDNKYPRTVILDCYTDEPSGYGVRPYLGTHQIHLSQALAYSNIPHSYLTIEDLRFASGDYKSTNGISNLHTYNRTKNCLDAFEIINQAETIYIIMGCFIEYNYFTCIPPKSSEVHRYLKETKAKKVLFYVMGTKNGISTEYQSSELKNSINVEEHGNTYRYILEGHSVPILNFKLEDFNLIKPNYPLLNKISSSEIPIIQQLNYPIIAEIETGTGCNTPFCTFCIESVRAPKTTYREPSSIISQIKALYNSGVRHFRLGRQPNFYHYQKQNVSKMEELLYGIRESCPDLETLHIDNANIINVINKSGREITRLIAEFCTSGNITPFGIESFDDEVRKKTGVVGSAEQVMQAIEIVNEYGQGKGNDGFPVVLPGINLIYNLPGQTSKTHEINMKYLRKILDSGFHTRRLYYRNMTRPTGVSFETGPNSTEEYNRNFKEIINDFIMPMQEEIYPKNTLLKNFREIKNEENTSCLRTMGTCSIRVEVNNVKLIPYKYYDVQITENIGYRLLKGNIVYEGASPSFKEEFRSEKN